MKLTDGEILADLLNIPAAIAHVVFDETRSNLRKLKGCERHAFEPLVPLREVYRCAECDGHVDVRARYWYGIGLTHGDTP